jgi:hypothetical protein
VATISAQGLVTAVAVGTATLTATVEGKEAAAAIKVDVDLASLGVIYAQDPGYNLQLYSMNGDGSNKTYVSVGFNPTQVGNLLIARGGLNDNSLYSMSPTGANRTLILGGGPNYVPHLNSNGTQFVHMRGDCGSNGHPVAITNSNGSGTNTSGLCTQLRPQWSPVADQIAFGMSNVIYKASTNFANVQAVLNVATFGSFDWTGGLAWSPDGTRLLFSARPTGSSWYSIYVVNADGTGLTRLTNAVGYDDVAFDWSKQGDWLLITSGRSGLNQIWAISLDGLLTVQLTSATVPTTFDPRWKR